MVQHFTKNEWKYAFLGVLTSFPGLEVKLFLLKQKYFKVALLIVTKNTERKNKWIKIAPLKGKDLEVACTFLLLNYTHMLS